uniref:Uncharacterized protein n=1 Tax=Meloidogyne enterolobii TaxID=390850 RepID=A0A6V7WNT8_MELEN|nr:unnamed protein product [Meloidogyne enterolobii]
MRTPKQLEEWSFSTNNSDNIKDETLVEEENFKQKDYNLETSSIDGLSNFCGSCCSSKNISKSLKQRMEKLKLESEISNLKLQKASFFF